MQPVTAMPPARPRPTTSRSPTTACRTRNSTSGRVPGRARVPGGIWFGFVKPPPFDYSSPDTLEEALAILADVGDEARPLAGGQSLIPLLSLRLARPSHLIDLAGIGELKTIEASHGSVILGAMVRERQA